MKLPRTTDAAHKVQMYRLLVAILNDNWLSQQLVFKGGTCAVLRGWLDRFSVDLDFDLPNSQVKLVTKNRIQEIISHLGYEIKDQSQKHVQYFLKYPAPPHTRNTLKLEINDQVSPYNESEIATLSELNRLAVTQTQSTMVANKMVAALGRLGSTGKTAGRDFYDLHHFLSQGYEINIKIVEDLTGIQYPVYIKKLIEYIEHQLTDDQLYQDINPLIPGREVKDIVKRLREELLWLLRGLVGEGLSLN